MALKRNNKKSHDFPIFDASGTPDLLLAGLALALVVVGLVMVYSASSPLALRRFNDPAYYALRNGIYAFLGFFTLIIVGRLSTEAIRRIGRIGFWISLLALLLVLIPGISHEAGGARRWLNFHLFTVQPSEIFKVTTVLYMAHLLSTDPGRAQRMKGGLVPIILLFSIAATLLLAEPDFGTTLITGTVMMGMVFLAGIPIFWISILFLFAIPAAALGIMIAPYRLIRFLSFLDPWDDPLNTDFQLSQSLIAIGNGGLTGVGLGEGQQKQFYLPEAHTDFILAVISEELGLLWILFLIILFALLVWRAFRISRYNTNSFAALASSGLAILIGTQALANMGVVMGLLPPKGLTLPLVSYGGSSLIITMGAIGLLIAFSRTVKPPPKNRARR
ncbi:putative lipid II flippase FtsW [Magnetococcales bacterium HHB-1]